MKKTFKKIGTLRGMGMYQCSFCDIAVRGAKAKRSHKCDSPEKIKVRREAQQWAMGKLRKHW